MDDAVKLTYSKTDVEGVWQIYIKSSISAMFDHYGYVYADEAGLFSMSIYPTTEDALTALHLYNEGLNAYDATGSEFNV